MPTEGVFADQAREIGYVESFPGKLLTPAHLDQTWTQARGHSILSNLIAK